MDVDDVASSACPSDALRFFLEDSPIVELTENTMSASHACK